jgi:beta-xylosidase
MDARRRRSVGAATYTNPVYPGYLADPFVLRHDSRYYAYGTNDVEEHGRAFEILVSDDLVHWTLVGRALDAVDGLDARDHWAPEVAEHDGRFYMYFSAGVEDREHKLRVAVAQRPEGPFVYTGRVLTPSERFAIDASPFRDEDGQWYLYYARDDLTGERVGTSLVVDRLIDMERLAGKPTPVLRASADWQLFMRQRPMYGRVYDWYTLEGPSVLKRAGRYFCFYSGGAWKGAGYGVSWAVAETPFGPFTSAPGDRAALLRTRQNEVIGPGHCSIVVGPDGRDYVVYHAWDVGHSGRRMCLDLLEWVNGEPRTNGPTNRPQPVP